MRNLACLLAAGLLAAACSLMPRYQAPPNPAPTQYKELNAGADCASSAAPAPAGPSTIDAACAWEPATPSDRTPRGDWWQGFQDPTLNDLEARIDAANPDLAVAADRYREAHAVAQEARSALFPTIGVTAYPNMDRQSNNRPLRSASQPDSYHDDFLAGSLNYELDLWGRVRSAVIAGSTAAQSVAADLESVRLALHAELASDYIILRVEDAQRQLLQQAVDAYGRAQQMTTTRLQGGIASGLDEAQAETQLQTARADLTDVILRRATIEHAIGALTGQLASDFSIAPTSIDLTLPEVPVGMPSTLLQRRPDVAAAERRMASYNAQIGIARAAFFPRITLAAVAGFESTQLAGLLGMPNRFWAVGPQGSLTLFDAGYRSAVVAGARAHFDEAADSYRAAVLRAFRDVEDALARRGLLQQELAQQQAARAAAERALQIAMNRYQEGAVSYLQVVSEQITALQAERAALDLRSLQLQASVDLVRALGGGWQAPWPVTAQRQQP
ncbi:MAG TPA: efflux transporter outer membrane subunit [Steroidobacteraceae bacterium]